MHASKIQDQVEPIIGIYRGPVKGKYKKDDFLFDRSIGPIKILGITDLANKLARIPIGTEIIVKYDKTIKLSNGHDFIVVKVSIRG